MFKQRIKTFISPHKKSTQESKIIYNFSCLAITVIKSSMTIKLQRNVIKIFRESDIKQLIPIS